MTTQKTNPKLFGHINVNGVSVPCKVVAVNRNDKGRLTLDVSVTATKKRTDRKGRDTITAIRGERRTLKAKHVKPRVKFAQGETWTLRMFECLDERLK